MATTKTGSDGDEDDDEDDNDSKADDYDGGDTSTEKTLRVRAGSVA